MATFTPSEFQKKYLNKRIDVDNFPASQPFQCWDLWAKFCMDYYGSRIGCKPTGYAYSVFNEYETNGAKNNYIKITDINNFQDGDWVFWNYGSKIAPKSHVAMFRSYTNKNKSIQVFNQNAGGKYYATTSTITLDGVLGALRPKMYVDETREEDKGEKLYLPAKNNQGKNITSWAVYPLDKQPIKKNAKGFLNPSKFGGLTYDILDRPNQNVVTIQTRDFGKVNIWIAKDTPAIIK